MERQDRSTLLNQAHAWPSGESACCACARKTDWSETALGPVKNWPTGLRATADLVLACGFPMVLLWGPELIQIYNDGYAEIMGDRHPAGMGQPTAACWPEVWNFNEPIYKRVFAGETVSFEDQLLALKRKGVLSDAYFDLCFSPVRAENGKIAGVLVTVFETTEKRQASEVSRESEQLLWALVEASSYSVYRMSPDWSEMRALHGRGFLADTSTSNTDWLQQYILAEDQATVLKVIQAAIHRKGIFELEHRVRRVDGGIGWTFSRAVPIFARSGEIQQWIGAASDVTDKKLAQEELKQAKERLAAVFECLPVGMAIFDQQGKFLLNNREMLRFAPSETVPSQDDNAASQWKAYDAEGLEVPRSDYPAARALRGEAVLPGMEMLHTAEDGTSTWTRVATVPIRNLSGEVTERVVVVTDINDLKLEAEQLEEQVGITSNALGETRRELQALSHHLMTAQEEESRRIARNLHDDLGQRVALLGFKVDALEAHLPLDGRFDLQSLRQQVHELAKGLRAVSHRLHPAIIADLGISDALLSLLQDFRLQGMDLYGKIEPLIQLPLEASTAFYRIVQEALRNVQKHAPDAPVEVRLWQDGQSLQLSIRDRGQGFSLAALGAGSGLGLVSMQERARLVGGAMLLSSRPGEGTTVLVRLTVEERVEDGQLPGLRGGGSSLDAGADGEYPLRPM